jgi:O-antigen/teichoic acid export membrane protein
MLGTRVVLLPLGFLQGALLARALGPEGVGRYSAALVDVNVLVTVLSLGLPGALAVLQGEARDDPARLRALWRLGLVRAVPLALALLALAGVLVGFGDHPALAWLARGRTPALLALIGGCVLLQYLRDVHNSLLWGGQHFSAQNRLNLVLALGQLAATWGLYARAALGPVSALLLHASSQLLLCAASGLWLWRWQLQQPIPQAAPATLNAVDGASLARRALRIGSRNFLHILPDLLLLRIDVYLIQRLLPAGRMERDLGIYQAGVRVAELLLMVPGTLNTVLFAKAAAREEADLAQVTLRSAQLALLLGLIACACMALVGQPLLVAVYGARFAGSFLPALVVLLGCSALCFSGPLAGTLSGAGGYPRSVIYAQSAALGVNIAANLYLLPRYGIRGSAAASALAYGCSALLIAIAFFRRFGLRPSDLWPRRIQ